MIIASVMFCIFLTLYMLSEEIKNPQEYVDKWDKVFTYGLIFMPLYLPIGYLLREILFSI
jgi:hypothetical protein